MSAADGDNRRPRIAQLVRSFGATLPVDMASRGAHDVFAASRHLDEILAAGHTGFTHQPWQQVAAALKLARH